jgi:uncharacterized protein (DUF2252 family)
VARDVAEEIVAYNRPLVAANRVQSEDGRDLTAEALRRKLDALAATPFRFFRGTFHLMARDLLEGRVPGAAAAAPDAFIVGDLHLENFGVYRGASGELSFDVNDFDDVGFGPADVDVKRLCTSAFLLPGLGQAPRLAAARAIARGWADAVERIGGRFPVAPYTDQAEGLCKALLAEKGKRTQHELIAKFAPDKGHTRFLDGSPAAAARMARVGRAWQVAAQKSFDEYAASLRQLKAELPGGWQVLDAVYRFRGTGSLGRLRFWLLIECEGEQGGGRHIVEIKEARPSALDEARGRPPPQQRARVQTAAIRRMQGDPWPRVAGTHLGKAPALGREIQPEEEKVESDRFAAGQGDAGHAQLLSYAAQCGEVIGRMHCRSSAPLLLDADWKPQEAARAAVEFAAKYAEQVEADQQAFIRRREAVANALGLSGA